MCCCLSRAGRRSGHRAAGGEPDLVPGARAASHGVGVREHARVRRPRHRAEGHLPPGVSGTTGSYPD